MSENLSKKLDARGLHQLERGLSGAVDVLIRTITPPTAQQRRELLEAGCVPRSVVGNILSATVPNVARLEDLARLPFIRRIEMSRAMFEE